ncbi:hypothetical protein BDW66DRAFT_135453 [Aspergillus desertorum]
MYTRADLAERWHGCGKDVTFSLVFAIIISFVTCGLEEDLRRYAKQTGFEVGRYISADPAYQRATT